MGRKKGSEKTGGRRPGSKNVVQSDVKTWIRMLIDGNRDKFEKDLESIDAGQRLVIMERLFRYITPTMASVDVQTQIKSEYEQLEALLKKSPSDAVEKIAKRVIELKKSKDNG